MTELIVALDCPVERGRELYGVMGLGRVARWFKIGVPSLIEDGGFALAQKIAGNGDHLMLDLKLYDTPDTVERAMALVDHLRAAMVTVHVRWMHAATQASDRVVGAAVIAVDHLTSDGPAQGYLNGAFAMADGIVCHPCSAPYYRQNYGRGKILVCPGVRPSGEFGHNHLYPVTPAEAAELGADFIVVGRPIWQASDPAAVARSITEELSEKRT